MAISVAVVVVVLLPLVLLLLWGCGGSALGLSRTRPLGGRPAPLLPCPTGARLRLPPPSQRSAEMSKIAHAADPLAAAQASELLPEAAALYRQPGDLSLKEGETIK